MQILLNREDIAEAVATRILRQVYSRTSVEFTLTDAYLAKMQKKLEKSGLLEVNFAEVNNLINQDLLVFKDWIIADRKSKYRPLVNWLSDRIDNLPIPNQTLTKWVANEQHKSFIKQIASHISDDKEYITLVDNIDTTKPVLLRNVIHHVPLIKELLETKNEFWFVDSGYTNFLSTKGKPWHRLCHNHIHANLKHNNFPADRLSLLPSMPRPWSTNGNRILVVENSDYHYHMFGTTRDVWRTNIKNILEQHTDRPVEYRDKEMNKKIRTSVYEHLMKHPDEYYCVITDASAAAVEAIWAGVPVITLNQHITNPVARSKVEDIDNLYTGPIGDWLCALTYSQFTKRELERGQAQRIIEKYHA